MVTRLREGNTRHLAGIGSHWTRPTRLEDHRRRCPLYVPNLKQESLTLVINRENDTSLEPGGGPSTGGTMKLPISGEVVSSWGPW